MQILISVFCIFGDQICNLTIGGRYYILDVLSSLYTSKQLIYFSRISSIPFLYRR